FKTVLEQTGAQPSEIVFLAHSTTQATNALLEGDVATVGILGMAAPAAASLAEPQVRICNMQLEAGRVLPTANRFVVTAAQSDNSELEQAIDELISEGADVIVASSAFGVDTQDAEESIRSLCAPRGVLTTCGHEISRLYGLRRRTQTAVINASILPKMAETAALTEASVCQAGIDAPLMIMRGDGGVMSIGEMRRRPAMTMLSGPAASVAGTLMYLRVSDGIYFEVGGTSTNIGVVRDGRPAVSYARVGDHETYIPSLDVRVLGIGGGSLIRIEGVKITDVGPRSAHIAGLDYAAFAERSHFDDATLELFQPSPGDSGDYVRIRSHCGALYALTTTCAANALGIVNPGVHAHGNPEAARAAMSVLARHLRLSVADAARQILECACEKLQPVFHDFTRDYRLDPEETMLIGAGGGAGALVPFCAERGKHPYQIATDAEVISSIGVALALVRDVVERVIPHPKPADFLAIRNEAKASILKLGADPKSVDVTVEIDHATQRIRATAVGAAEMRARDIDGAITLGEARSIAAHSMDLLPREVELAGATSYFRVFRSLNQDTGLVRVVDPEGTIRLRRRGASVTATIARDAASMIAQLSAVPGQASLSWSEADDLLMLHDRHLVDLSGLDTVDQIGALAQAELAEIEPTEPVLLIMATNNRRGDAGIGR
ncbi:MAG: hydantoinase/oxoprolinase family protein, partial [Hyphomicrobiaceae bacterium]